MSSSGSPRDLYAILGVPKDASAQDIKKAFRAVARECHPDVAGHDAAKLERFKRAKDAYETLSDPAARARYDRRGQPRTGPFVGSHWAQGGVRVNTGGPPPSSKATNDLDLEDIFNDFGGVDFGFGGPTRGQPASTPQPPPRTPPPPKREPPRPQPGRDLSVAVDVPWEVAERGGTVTVAYPRLRRAEDGHTLYNYDELYDLKVPPGTRHGQTLRVEKMGDAGLHGGPYGELVCDVKVVGAPPKDPGRMKMPGREDPSHGPNGELRVDIGVAEAILGGRVTVQTPAGPVRVSIPAGTSSGTRMRLRGKGPPGADGAPGDLVAELRIVVPKDLDEESRRLIERFAELNPTPGD
ncbi:MAG: DnaJ C-terminal domain-containing protein [Myxococcota bacterium]